MHVQVFFFCMNVCLHSSWTNAHELSILISRCASSSNYFPSTSGMQIARQKGWQKEAQMQAGWFLNHWDCDCSGMPSLDSKQTRDQLSLCLSLSVIAA
jgi:hypothetical protein